MNKTNRNNRIKCQKGVKQSTLCSNINHYKTNKYVSKKHKKGIRESTLAKIKDKYTKPIIEQ